MKENINWLLQTNVDRSSDRYRRTNYVYVFIELIKIYKIMYVFIELIEIYNIVVFKW
jgi:hypothetical protein